VLGPRDCPLRLQQQELGQSKHTVAKLMTDFAEDRGQEVHRSVMAVCERKDNK